MYAKDGAYWTLHIIVVIGRNRSHAASQVACRMLFPSRRSLLR
jgi:hypothetical protein